MCWADDLHCCDGELGMPSSQLQVRQVTGNTSFLCGTRVGLSLDPSPQQGFPFLLFQIVADRQQVISVQCMAVSSPSIGHTTYTGRFG